MRFVLRSLNDFPILFMHGIKLRLVTVHLHNVMHTFILFIIYYYSCMDNNMSVVLNSLFHEFRLSPTVTIEPDGCCKNLADFNLALDYHTFVYWQIFNW